MANPVLNERALRRASVTWAPPEPASGHFPPVDDGPTSGWSREVMTVNGVITATATLFVLLLASAAVGWIATGGPTEVALPDGSTGYEYGFPGLAIAGVIVGFGLAMLLRFKPNLAKVIAPIYAIVQGFVVGSFSRVYETYYDGVVVQAAGATVGVFVVMLVLYRTGVINVTERFRKVVVTATLGVMVFYGVSFLFSMFGGSVSFLSSPSPLGIGFSVLVAGLAAFNLALDFDFIERGAKQGLDKRFEWYAAFGLLVTVVWLYLELLRLLSKLRQR
jgi:uncharacterized YccA/Bax inhibitor family protein